MRIVLLTTATSHHLYYAVQVNRRYPLHAIILETGEHKARYETFHPFERERDDYEREVLLSGCTATFSDLADSRSFLSINEDAAVMALKSLTPEVVLVFGTGRLNPPVLETAAVACLNLHGGHPERYRGLDSHLWAIYHSDFDCLVTTLHKVDAELDTGDIVAQAQLPLSRDMRLFQLRSVNTKACVDLTLMAMLTLNETGQVPSRKQTGLGRYYSFMPSALKEECVRKFERHTAAL